MKAHEIIYENPQPGHTIDIEFGDLLIETEIVDVTEDGVVVHLDETAMKLILDAKRQYVMEAEKGDYLDYRAERLQQMKADAQQAAAAHSGAPITRKAKDFISGLGSYGANYDTVHDFNIKGVKSLSTVLSGKVDPRWNMYAKKGLWKIEHDSDYPRAEWYTVTVTDPKHLHDFLLLANEINPNQEVIINSVKGVAEGFSTDPTQPGTWNGHRIVANRKTPKGSYLILQNKNDGKYEIHRQNPRVVGGLEFMSVHKTPDEMQAAFKKLTGVDESIQDVAEAKYQGRTVQLGKRMKGDVKKFKVYVKNKKGNVIKVNFGQKGVKIKKNNPARRKSFRARHNCATAKDRTTPRYWSCRAW